MTAFREHPARTVDEQNDLTGRLQEANTNLALALDVARAGMFRYEPESGRIVWSERLERLHGLEPGTYDGSAEQAIATVHEGDRDWLVTRAEAAIADTVPFEAEYRVVWPDGSVHWLETKGNVVDDGGEVAFVGVSIDIDARKAAETSEQRFSKLFSGAPLGIMLIELVDGGRKIEVNERLCQITGYSREELLSAPLASHIHPLDRQTAIRLLREVEDGVRSGFVRDLRFAAAGGHERWVRVTCSVLDAERGPLLVVAMFEDISDQLAAQTRLQAVFDNAPVGVAIGGADGTIHEVNGSFVRMLGYENSYQLIGLTFPQISHPDDASTAALVREHFGHDAGHLQFEKRYLRRDGEPVWARVTVAPLGPDNDMFVSLIEDLSETRTYEEQLRQAQKLEAIGLLAGGIAHDFNNLMMVIGGYANLLDATEELSESARMYVDEIAGAFRRGVDLTGQLLAFSRRTHLDTHVLDLNDSVREIEGLLNRLVGEHVTVALALDPDLAAVEADDSQLGQVLMNLAANARDAMSNGGVLEIATRNRDLGSADAERLHVPAGAYVELAVSDTGVGMDERTLAHLFEPFFTTKAQGKGTGLGLSVTHGIVTQSGGAIEVESAPGAGATFRILLPQSRASTESAGRAVAASVRPAALAATVLLVEDDDQVRVLTRQMLEQIGCTVLEAASPAEALAIGRTRRDIDVLVTDVVMPEMNGPALFDELAAERAELPVLYVSGYTSNALSGRRSELGSAFLTKPFTREQLQMALVNLIGHQDRSVRHLRLGGRAL